MKKHFSKESTGITVGKNLKRLRQEKGLSQAELAELAGLSKNFISYIENGKCGISSKTLASLANALRVELAQLYTTESSLSNPQVGMYANIIYKIRDDVDEFLDGYLAQIVKEEEEKDGKDKNE